MSRLMLRPPAADGHAIHTLWADLYSSRGRSGGAHARRLDASQVRQKLHRGGPGWSRPSESRFTGPTDRTMVRAPIRARVSRRSPATAFRTSYGVKPWMNPSL